VCLIGKGGDESHRCHSGWRLLSDGPSVAERLACCTAVARQVRHRAQNRPLSPILPKQRQATQIFCVRSMQLS